jgi:hypothetical protein
VLLDLGLEFFFEAAAHPLTPLHFDFQFHVTQRTCGACFRVHPSPFVFVFSLSEEEPIFPALSMVRVSSCAPSLTRYGPFLDALPPVL